MKLNSILTDLPSFQAQRPLTRYLPVRNEHFDLRSHIETAGHQIELLSTHIVLNSSSCRGYLHKLAGSGSSKFRPRGANWNKRWFVFDRNKRTLVYYQDKQEGKAKGGIYFQVMWLAIYILSRLYIYILSRLYIYILSRLYIWINEFFFQFLLFFISVNWRSLCGPLELSQIPQPQGHLLHEDSWPYLLPHGTHPWGHENMGGCHLHRGRGLSRVPSSVVIRTETNTLCQEKNLLPQNTNKVVSSQNTLQK